jgi:Flp pilus assembly protein CpaB
LLVTNKDAEKIQFASTMGQLSLSLRGDRDEVTEATESGSITLNYMLGVGNDTRAANGLVRVRNEDGSYQQYIYNNGRLEAEPPKPAPGAE